MYFRYATWIEGMSSQHGQDILALEILQGKRGGFFLDSGAADGVSASNTQLLESTFGWRGICVEPNQALFAKLIQNRRCFCLNCCLYDRDGSVDFLESAKMLGGIMDEYHPAHLQYAKTVFRLPENTEGRLVTVQRIARTVRSVLRECSAPRVIDYWSLDTEGSELAILRSFPFDEYSFRVLSVEHNRFSSREQIRVLLEGNGYRRMRLLDIDDCYVKDELVPRISYRSSVWNRIGRGRTTRS